MNHNILEKYSIDPQKMRKKKNVEIIEDQEHRKFVMKKNEYKTKDLYSYLRSRNFHAFPKIYSDVQDPEDLLEYLEDMKIEDAQRIEDMLYLLSILHTKTTYYKEVDLDKIKEIYESMTNQFSYLLAYYQSLQEMMEEEIFLAPSHYYLLLNSSKIYKILNNGKQALDFWYEEIKNEKNIRFALNHQNLKKDHLIENDQLYFISWNQATFASPIEDLVNLFQENYKEIDLSILLSLYETRFRLLKYEKYFLIAKVSMLKRVSLNQEEEKVIEEVADLIAYIDKVDNYFLKQDSNKSNEYPKQKS